MTVRELREKLALEDPEALVLTHGYEDGYNEAGKPEKLNVYQERRAWYYGDYWQVEEANDPRAQKAVLI